jgi:hypothetical protein
MLASESHPQKNAEQRSHATSDVAPAGSATMNSDAAGHDKRQRGDQANGPCAADQIAGFG